MCVFFSMFVVGGVVLQFPELRSITILAKGCGLLGRLLKPIVFASHPCCVPAHAIRVPYGTFPGHRRAGNGQKMETGQGAAEPLLWIGFLRGSFNGFRVSGNVQNFR